MKTKFFLIFCILASATTLFAQSGRPIPTPETTPSQVIENSKIEETKKELPPCETNLEEYIYISPRKIKEFSEELNRYGNCGYRLEKSNKIPLGVREPEFNSAFFAVMKLDAPNRYEYQWFEAYNPGEAQTRMNIRAKQGFYFKASYLFQLVAANEDGSFSDIVTNELRSTYGTFLIFEKKAGELKQREYRVLFTDAIDRKIREHYQNNLNSSITKGFRPIGVIKEGARFALIMEYDTDFLPKGEYLISTSWHIWGLCKRLTELNKLGYKPIFITTSMTLVCRENSSNQNDLIFYTYSQPEKINQKQFISVTSRYFISGIDESLDDLSTNLIFVSDKNQTKQFEYKLHKMTNVGGRPKGIDKYDALRQPPTAEMLAEFQNLLKQGYVIREILASKEIYILFERPKK